MARVVIIYGLNFILWVFIALQFFGRNGFNLLPDLIGVAVGATLGFFGIRWRLRNLASKRELTGSRKDLGIAAIVIIAGVYILFYPGPAATVTALPEISSGITTAAAAGWGGYVLAFLWWENMHGMDIVSEGKWGNILRAVPKHERASS